MSSIHPADLPDDVLMADVDEVRTKGSGPGGQHRNKNETAVRLTHRPTGVFADASERRSLARNQSRAVHRLKLKLALEWRVEREEGDVPSELWRRRVASPGKLSIAASSDDFPPLLAEALDVLAMHGDDAAAAAGALETSISRYVKFLKLEPTALSRANARRREKGLRPWQ